MHTEKKHDLLVIMPAYNEGKNLPGVFNDMREKGIFDIADVLIVNDASSDNTAETAKKNGAKCITFVHNLGYGNALQTGYRYAKGEGYRYLIQMDADGQHDCCNIPVIYGYLKTKDIDGQYPDIVLGSRFMKGSGEYDPGFFKKIGYKWFDFLFRIFGKGSLADATTGLQGLSRRAFSYYAGFGNFDAKYPDANIVLEMQRRGYKIVQVPAVMHIRTEGTSMHAGIWSPVKYMVRLTVAVIVAYFRTRHVEPLGQTEDR